MTTEGNTEGKTFTQADIDKAIQTERAHAQHFKQEAEELKGKFKDIDPAQALKDREELQRLKREKATQNPDDIKALEEAAREDERKRIGAQLTERDKALETATEKLKRLEVIQPAMLEAAKIFNSNELELIQILIEKNCMMHEGHIVVRGADGKPEPSADPRNGNKKLGEYLSELSAKYPGTVKPTISPGGRAHGEVISSKTGDVTPDRFLAMSEAERANLPRDQQMKLSAQVFKRR